MHKEEILIRISVLSSEIDCAEEEIRFAEDEIRKLYDILDGKGE